MVTGYKILRNFFLIFYRVELDLQSNTKVKTSTSLNFSIRHGLLDITVC